MKKELKNRLSEIMENENHNAKSFADEIGSTEGTISDCANGKKQLRIDLALKIYEKFKYSLDYIYNIECNSMMIDFRDLLKFKDNMIRFYIPKKYVKYIIESEKYRDLSELRKSLENYNEVQCRISVKKEDMFQCIRSGDVDIPYCDNDFDTEKHELITREEVELCNYNIAARLDENSKPYQASKKLFDLITNNLGVLNSTDIDKIIQYSESIIEKRK